MIVQGIVDKKELERLCRWYEDCLRIVPNAKTRALKAAAEAVKEELDRQIESRVNDVHGKVRGWQQVTMGSGGGYSRVGAVKEAVSNRYGKRYGYHSIQVTQYLEHGHAAPSPRGKNPNYSPRLNAAIFAESGKVIVPGRMFYSYTKMKASELGIAAMEDELERLTDEFVDLLYDKS